MKPFKKSILFACNIFTVGLLIFVASCDKPKVVPESERVTNLLKSSSWVVLSVKVDDVAVASFANMTLAFTSTSYSTTNGGLVWPASGTWAFSDQTGKVIKRNDRLVINIDTLSENILALSLNWANTTLGGGRNDSVGGKYVFSFR